MLAIAATPDNAAQRDVRTLLVNWDQEKSKLGLRVVAMGRTLIPGFFISRSSMENSRYASDPDHIRLFSRPLSGGAASAVADIAPGVLYGLAVDPSTHDFVFARTTAVDEDIGLARLERR